MTELELDTVLRYVNAAEVEAKKNELRAQAMYLEGAGFHSLAERLLCEAEGIEYRGDRLVPVSNPLGAMIVLAVLMAMVYGWIYIWFFM